LEKNFRKTPSHILIKLQTITPDEIQVGCLKQFSAIDIENGLLAHLGIVIKEAELSFPDSLIPLSTQGKHSKRNIDGQTIKRSDLPKEKYEISFESPNWGDSYYGTHTVTWEKERYPRQFIAPRDNEIHIDCMDASDKLQDYVFRFHVSEVLLKGDEEFEDRLFDCVNILQENVGASDVAAAGSTMNDYLQTLNVAWDILPPGTVGEAINRLFQGRTPDQVEVDVATERYDFFLSLNPTQIIYGRSGLNRYFGALIQDDLVVFENTRYGNAVYIMFENWRALSQKSRVELMSSQASGFERVLHTTNWKIQVTAIVEAHRK